jgi:D-sedoheptulose 7-phosphate isomerase
MERSAALAHVVSGLREGAELRIQLAQTLGPKIVDAAQLIAECLSGGGKVLLFGNGGSAADAQHLAAELVGRFVLERNPLPGIALTTDSSILTAVGNDYGFDQVFVRQVLALGRPKDVAIGISTSGNSPNVIKAVQAAAGRGLRTIGFAGRDGGALANAVEIAITVPSMNTARIQECHIAVGHVLCELVENELFGRQTAEQAHRR